MIVILCDRCQAEIARGNNNISHRIADFTSGQSEEIALCDKCYDEFKRWVWRGS